MAANLRGEIEGDDLVWSNFVANIDYDAKGQRRELVYGNGVRSTYEYDPETFRLVHMRTLRGSDHLQDLFYTYDPVGNITHIQDEAQQTIYFDNVKVLPHADYIYDAVYRLIQAKGREHLGQVAHYTPYDTGRTALPHPNNGHAIIAYTERYLYDYVGNILEMQHGYNNGSNGGWTRRYTYAEESLIDKGKISNRLSHTIVGNNRLNHEPHTYDEHGNVTHMNHLNSMHWDYRDQLQQTIKQVVNNGQSPETTFYVYDSGGQRIRKVTEKSNGYRKNERLYLGGFEIYRQYDNNDASPMLERETLHIMDDQQRIALVETRFKGSEPVVPELLVRYQLGNHLGSASLEVDDSQSPKIISYEEYFPYGSTSYQGVRNDSQVSLKRYRYTGKERDEETGFNYHGARYYTPWLGRWVSADRSGLNDGMNLYSYVSGRPIIAIDPTGNEMIVDIKNRISRKIRNRRTIKEAIDLFSKSKTAKTKLGKGVLTELRKLYRENDISYEDLPKDVGGKYEYNLLNSYILVDTKSEGRIGETSIVLVHEATHSYLRDHANVNDVDNEIYCRLIEMEYYKELSKGVGKFRLPSDSIRKGWLEDVQKNKVVDRLAADRDYKHLFTANWIAEHYNDWGGLSQRSNPTKVRWIRTLMEEGRKYDTIIFKLFMSVEETHSDFLIMLAEIDPSSHKWQSGADKFNEIFLHIRYSPQYYRQLQEIQKFYEKFHINFGVKAID